MCRITYRHLQHVYIYIYIYITFRKIIHKRLLTQISIIKRIKGVYVTFYKKIPRRRKECLTRVHHPVVSFLSLIKGTCSRENTKRKYNV